MERKDYRRLGDFIRAVDVRNKELQCSNLLGLSIAKIFIPSIANIIGTDLSNYKIVHKDQFAYVPVTSRNGEKITVALYDNTEDCIVSQAYTVFEITDTNSLLPDYLMLWFRRPEFDRYARFKSIGSAREVFDWNEMCNVELPVPPISEQQKIVSQYQAIEHRIAVNKSIIQKLEDATQAIYRKMFVEDVDFEHLPNGWRMGTLSEIATINSGKTCPDKVSDKDTDHQYKVAGASGVIGYSSTFNSDKKLLTTGRVGTLGKTCRYNERMWYADNVLVVSSNYYEYCYQVLEQLDFNVLIKFGVQSLITQTGLLNYPIVIPSKDELCKFEKISESFFAHISLLNKENEILSANVLKL